MAVMPGVQFTNTAVAPSMSRYDIVCIHTIVGFAPAHAAHFSTRWDGHIFQSRDTRYKSAANLNGNHRIIAIENEDYGSAFGSWNTSDGHAVPAFTEAQIEAIARICAWAHQAHGIPLVLCPDSKPGSRGIAFHRQGCDGNFAGFAFGGRVAGGELWSSAFGKVCPGDRRIDQLINRIIPRARQLAGLESGGFLMALSDQEQRSMYNRMMGFLRQRWFVMDQGVPVAVPEGTAGALPATALDSLDGNYLVQRSLEAKNEATAAKAAVVAVRAELEALRSTLATPEIDLDLEVLATKVAQKLGALKFEAQPSDK